jgi:hypothetical protein
VTLASKPKGFPIAMAISPGFSLFELPSFAGVILVDPDKGKIGVGIIAEDTAGVAASIERRHIGALGTLHDVTIGENEPVRR